MLLEDTELKDLYIYLSFFYDYKQNLIERQIALYTMAKNR